MCQPKGLTKRATGNVIRSRAVRYRRELSFFQRISEVTLGVDAAHIAGLEVSEDKKDRSLAAPVIVTPQLREGPARRFQKPI